MKSERYVSTKLTEELGSLLYYHPPKQMSQNLRKMMMDYIKNETEFGIPDYFSDLISSLDWLFNFLDVAEQEFKVTCEDKDFDNEDDSISTNADSAIGESINFIVRMIQPEKIFVLPFDSPENNENDPYFDLIIVIPDTSKRSFKDYETLIELSCFKNTRVTFSVHQSNTLAKQITDCNLFYSTACIATNLVYDNKLTQLPSPDPKRLTAAKDRALMTFTAGYNKAISFFQGAKGFYHKGDFAITAFMLQQATELTLRAVVLAMTGNDVRTHSIVELLKNCRRVAPRMTTALIDEVQLLNLLEGAYLNSRYNEKYSVKEDEIIILIEKVKLLQACSEQVFKDI